MNTECATFHLNTTDISTSTDIYTQYGSINAYRNDITWNNVSLRTILGDMYNKYDKFNIKLSAILYSQSAVIPSSNSLDLNLQINIDDIRGEYKKKIGNYIEKLQELNKKIKK